tara:strand:+ start:2100 stop:2849 length:750 start_codon:yes stop_codon:yes gene_type:complete
MISLKKIFTKIIGWYDYKLISKNYIKNLRTIGKKSNFKMKFILDKIFQEFKINSLIQIGANDGVRFDELNNYIKKYRINSVLVEPVPRYFEELQLNYKNYEFVKLENLAISNDGEEKNIYTVKDQFIDTYDEHINGINSFNKSHLIKHGVKEKHIESKNIKSTRIKNLIEKNNITNLKLLCIDTEGYDGNIVYDFLETVNQRPIIIFEFIHIDSIFFEKVIMKLDEKKYSYFEIHENLVCTPIEKKNIL